MANPVSETSKVSKRGTFVISARLRQQFGRKEGSLVIAAEMDEGILLRPETAIPTTGLTQQRVEKLLLEELTSKEWMDKTTAVSI